MIYLSACPNYKLELSYRLDILDDISVLKLALCSVLLDELGDTVRDMEFVRVRVLGLVSSESFDGSVSVLIECLYCQLAPKSRNKPAHGRIKLVLCGSCRSLLLSNRRGSSCFRGFLSILLPLLLSLLQFTTCQFRF